MKKEMIDVVDEMKKFHKRMDELFNDFYSPKLKIAKDIKMREPLVDVINNKDNIQIIAELPGILKKDVNISLDDDKVEIKAEKKLESETKGKNYYTQERSYSQFYKAITLPAKVISDKAKTKFENGVLTIDIPKSKILAPKKRILQLK